MSMSKQTTLTHWWKSIRGKQNNQNNDYNNGTGGTNNGTTIAHTHVPTTYQNLNVTNSYPHPVESDTSGRFTRLQPQLFTDTTIETTTTTNINLNTSDTAGRLLNLQQYLLTDNTNSISNTSTDILTYTTNNSHLNYSEQEVAATGDTLGRLQHTTNAGQTPTEINTSIPSINHFYNHSTQTHVTVDHQCNTNHWGNNMLLQKPKHHLRIGVRNINSLPKLASNHKNVELFNDIEMAQLDLIGISETNLAWHKLPLPDKPSQRFRSLSEHVRVGYAHNVTDKDWSSDYQSGGTMLICVGNISFRSTQFGKDKTGLGRWTWIRLRGKQGKFIRIYSIYRPVRASGTTTAYRQQQLHFLENNVIGCPRDIFFNDLGQELQEGSDAGDELIVMGDFNEDIRCTRISNFFAQFQLYEAIHKLHGGSTAPATYERGSVPIDGIFVSSTINTILGGYSDVHWGVQTDHRLLWIDIDLHSLFGTDSLQQWQPQARRLKMENPKIVDTYVRLRVQHHTVHNILLRLIHLTNQIQQMGYIIDNAIINEIETLDQLRLQGMLDSEARCRKLTKGKVAWSPSLQQSINNIRYLRLHLSAAKHQRFPNSRTLQALYKKTNLTQQPSTIALAEACLKEEYQQYNKLKQQATQLRTSYLEQLAMNISESTGDNAITIYNNLLKREEQRRMSRMLQRLKPTNRSGVQIIEAPDQHGRWIPFYNKSDIERGCMDENIRRFTQANQSPSLLDSQVNILGWTGNTTASTQILEGDMVPGLHPDLQTMAPFLKKPSVVVHDISTEVTSNDFIFGWRKAKERTSSGKSGLHFGHFKASCTHPTLIEIDRLFLQFSMKTGYALKRWKQGIDVMIPKKADSLRVDKLRTICLIEPDFNFMNKLYGKRMMYLAEKNGTIAPEQYGSRKKKSSILHATNKQLVFDIIRQTKTDASLMVLDAKSCYDRISPPFASLALRRQGSPQSYIDCMFQALDQMKHYVRTAHGDSTQYYRREHERLHGILQGNGAGPMIWVMVSTPILDRLRYHQRGIQFLTTDNQSSIDVTAFAFVDDVDIVQEIHLSDDTSETQTTLQLWENGLWSSGGTLVGDKSNWYILRHQLNGSRYVLAPFQQTRGQLILRAGQSSPSPIQQMDPNDACLALGVMFAPSGNMTPHTEYLMSKAQLWAERVRTKTINRPEAWYALQMQVMKQLEYSLLATTMSRSQINQIMQPILKSGLPRSGICRNLARSVVYSSIKYQGLGIQDPYVTQGLRKLLLLLSSSGTILSTTTKLIEHSRQLCQWECGLGDNFLLYPFSKPLSYITTSGWITCLWRFLTEHHLQLHRIQRNNTSQRFSTDDFIMHHLLISHPSKNEVHMFNTCRLFLGVTLISDIVTLDGKRIRPNVLNGKRDIQLTQRNLLKKPLPTPTRTFWNFWKQSLIKLMKCRNDTGILTTPLQISHFSTSSWRWFYSVSDNRIYEIKDNQTYYYSIYTNPLRQGSRRHSQRFANPRLCNQLPSDVRPITVYQRDRQVVLESCVDSECATITSPPTSNIVEWQHSITHHVADPDTYLLHIFNQNRLVLVSDGSVKTNIAAAAWIMTCASAEQEARWTGSCPIPRSSHELDSHRAEAFGILGAILMFHCALKQWSLPHTIHGSVLVVCDNESALRYAMDQIEYPDIDASVPDFDVFQSIRKLLKPNITYRWQHVVGHQDRHQQVVHDPLARLNLQADKLANMARLAMTNIPTEQPNNIQVLLPEQQWQLYKSHDPRYPICKNVEHTIIEYISEQSIAPFWNKKNRIPTNMFPQVNWPAIYIAMTSIKHSRRHWITKHAAQSCGVNSVLVKWRYKDNPTCPRCDKLETTAHVYHCHHPEVKDIWDIRLQQLREWMLDNKTSPSLCDTFILNLQNWYYNRPRLTDSSEAEQQQDHIGWDYVLEGCIGYQWQQVQEQYLLSIDSKRSGRRWAAALIKKLWDIAWDLWEHRNGIEHDEDARRINEQYDVTIQELITAGFLGFPLSQYNELISDHALHNIFHSTPEYKRCWIKHIQTIKQKLKDRHEICPVIAQMRNTMRHYVGLT